MKRVFPALMLASALAMALWSTGCPKSCGPGNCDGCCDATNTCQPSSKDSCGVQGDICSTCNAIQSCVLGACMFGGNNSGNGGNNTGTHTAATSTGSGSTEGSTGVSTGASSEGTTGRQTSTTGSHTTTTTTGSTGSQCFGIDAACEGGGACCAGLYCSPDFGVCAPEGVSTASSTSTSSSASSSTSSSTSSTTGRSTSTSTGTTGTRSSSSTGTTGSCFPSGTFIGGSGPDPRCCSGYVDPSGSCNAPPSSTSTSTGTTGRSSSSSSSGSTGTVCSPCTATGTTASSCVGGLICYQGFCDTPNTCTPGDAYCGGRGCTGISCACGQPAGSTSGSTGSTGSCFPNGTLVNTPGPVPGCCSGYADASGYCATPTGFTPPLCTLCTDSTTCGRGGSCIRDTTNSYCGVACTNNNTACADPNATCFSLGGTPPTYTCYPTSQTCE